MLGRAGIILTVLLLFTYGIVIFAVQSFAGVGDKGVGLENPDHQFDVLSVTGSAIFGSSGFGTVLSRLLILMVLKPRRPRPPRRRSCRWRLHLRCSWPPTWCCPSSSPSVSPRYLTPTVFTIVVGAASVALDIPLNFISGATRSLTP